MSKLTIVQKEQYLTILEREQENVRKLYEFFLEILTPRNEETKLLRLSLLKDYNEVLLKSLNNKIGKQSKKVVNQILDYHRQLLENDVKTK